MNKFKDIILHLRKEKGFTQEELASALHVSKGSVAMWETGNRLPSPQKYEEIADYFNVDIDYLYGRTNIRQKVHFDNDGTAYTPVVCENHSEYNSSESQKRVSYYYDELAAELAQELYDRPEMRVLFDASKKATKEDIEQVADILKKLSGK